jgi:subtilisin family serine protease
MSRRKLSWVLLAVLGLPCALPAGAMDRARVEAGVDAAVAKYGLTGKGVIVALLDRGIDWRNADFRNADGSTRIAWLYDLTDPSGATAPGNPYGKGTITSRQQVDAALAGGPAPAFRDAVGHGTTTAGISTGNGRNSAAKYRGVATEATIISVKVTSDGAPAHDGEPAEAAFYDPALLPLAIDFVRDKAREMGLPAVMLLNLGSQGGATNGASDLARKIDATVGPGVPGLVFVSGPGDDGGMANRAGGTVGAGATESIGIQKGVAGSMTVDLWYPEGDRLDVSIQSPSGAFGPYASPATNADYATVSNGTFTLYHLGSARTFSGALTGKREVWLRIDGPVGAYTLSLRGASVSGGRFDATLNPSQRYGASNANFFTDHVAPGSIWDGATARGSVCPGDYVVRNAWTDLDGVARSITGQGNPGEIWPGSSVGPTFDGRLGVDLCAPGNSVFTTYAPKSYYGTFRSNLIQDGGGLYGRASAVSAAAPLVAGVVALMLQANPGLDSPTVKAILQRSSRSDSFTGAVPNAAWGHGKLDAVLAVGAAAAESAKLYMISRRVSATVTWKNQYSGTSGTALPIPKGDQFGFFTFSDPANPEVFVKALDFGAGQPYLLFWAGLTDLEYTVTFTNEATGRTYTQTKPAYATAGGANTTDLPHSRTVSWDPESGEVSDVPAVAGRAVGPETGPELLLDAGQISVTVTWRNQYSGQTGTATPLPQDDQFGFFYIADAGNPEVFVKSLDWGASRPFLLFAAGLTNFEYTVRFRNVRSGQEVVFLKPADAYSGFADGNSMGR